MKNITLNPFSLNGSGKQHLTTSPNTDPDKNYFNQFTQCLNDCDYYDETSFCRLTESLKNNLFSIAHFNIRSIINKHDDFSSYLASLKHEFSTIGLTETWLTEDNLYDFQMPHYTLGNFCPKLGQVNVPLSPVLLFKIRHSHFSHARRTKIRQAFTPFEGGMERVHNF